MHTVIETPTFTAQARKSKISRAEVQRITDIIAFNPTAGDILEGTGGARKVRIALPGKGKSGGYRVITFYTTADNPIFLVGIFTKDIQPNLTATQKAKIKGDSKAMKKKTDE